MAGVHYIGGDTLGTEPIAGENLILTPGGGGETFLALRSIGETYEVGINGDGYMLVDVDGDPGYQRSTGQVELPRFATGSTPFSEAVDRYTFVPFSDFSDGAGQKFVDREDSSPRAFFDSRRLDPFSDPGRLLPLKGLASVRAVAARDTATNFLDKPDIPIFFLQNGEGLYLDDDDQVSKTSDGTDLVSLTTIHSMHTNGVSTLIARSDGAFRLSVAAAAVTTPTVNGIANIGGTAVVTHCVFWSTVAQRWCVGVAGNGVVGFTTLTGAASPFANEMGTDVYRFSTTTGGSTKTAVIRSITDGGGHVWFALTDYPSGNLNAVYAWRAGSADAPTVAYRFAQGETVLSVFYYQGNLFARVLAPSDRADTMTVVVYRFIQQGSSLVPVAVLDLGALSATTTSTLARSHLLGGWAAYGSRIYFGWKYLHGAGTYGVASFDLTTGGYAKWWDLDETQADATVVDGIAFNQSGVPYVLIAGEALYTANGDFPSGFLKTSVVDLKSTLGKQLVSASLTSKGSGGSIRVLAQIGLDGIPFDFTDVAGQILENTFDLTTIERLIPDLIVDLFSLRIEVAAAGATLTWHEKTVVQLHPVGLADQLIRLRINCSDNPTALSGKALPGRGVGAGSRRARHLETLVQTTIDFQDLDWRPGDVMEKWKVQSVDVPARNIRQSRQGIASQDQVALVTLRRFLK